MAWWDWSWAGEKKGAGLDDLPELDFCLFGGGKEKKKKGGGKKTPHLYYSLAPEEGRAGEKINPHFVVQ